MDRWEIRTVERAVRQRWNLPPEVYDQIPAKLYAVINDPKTPQRTKISATRTLLAMNAQNAETVIFPNEVHAGCEPVQEILVALANDPAYIEATRIRRDYATGRAEIQFFLKTRTQKMRMGHVVLEIEAYKRLIRQIRVLACK